MKAYEEGVAEDERMMKESEAESKAVAIKDQAAAAESGETSEATNEEAKEEKN